MLGKTNPSQPGLLNVPRFSQTSQLHIVGLYAINFCPFHPSRSAGIPFAPVEAARNKSVKN